MSSVDPQSTGAPAGEQKPIRLGTREEFLRVRRFFQAAQFNDSTLRAVLKVSDMSRVDEARDRIDRVATTPPLLASIELFVFGLPVRADDFQRICGDETFAAFTALNLIRQAKYSEGAIVCPVWVYAVDGFLVVSDRHDDPDGEAYHPRDDAVFPALDVGTSMFLRLLPAAPGGEALDLCGGCGIGALHLSRTVKRAVTADITERSAYFADFNGRLNGADIESLRGNLYAPVLGRQFDVIAAHPPWVPSTGDGAVFRDGGDLGESITQRIIEGIPHHLRNCGTAVIVSLGRDTTDAAYEQRVRTWLGAAGSDCDVVLGVEQTRTIEDVVASMRRLQLKGDAEAANRIADRFRESGTDKFVYGACFVRRTGQPVAEPPLRLRMSPRATAADFDRLFSWRLYRRSSGFRDWLIGAKPLLAAHLETYQHHVVKNRTLVADAATYSIEHGFKSTLRTDPWTLALISAFEGRRSVEQVFREARSGKRMPPDFDLFAFMDLVALMIEQGFLEVELPSRR